MMISSVYFTKRGDKTGWLIVALGQSLFAGYTILTGQYLFLILNFGMIYVASVAYNEWRNRDRQADQNDPDQLVLF